MQVNNGPLWNSFAAQMCPPQIQLRREKWMTVVWISVTDNSFWRGFCTTSKRRHQGSTAQVCVAILLCFCHQKWLNGGCRSVNKCWSNDAFEQKLGTFGEMYVLISSTSLSSALVHLFWITIWWCLFHRCRITLFSGRNLHATKFWKNRNHLAQNSLWVWDSTFLQKVVWRFFSKCILDSSLVFNQFPFSQDTTFGQHGVPIKKT